MSLTNGIVNVEQLVISIAKHTLHSIDHLSSSFHWCKETQKIRNRKEGKIYLKNWKLWFDDAQKIF